MLFESAEAFNDERYKRITLMCKTLCDEVPISRACRRCVKISDRDTGLRPSFRSKPGDKEVKHRFNRRDAEALWEISVCEFSTTEIADGGSWTEVIQSP